MDGVWMEHGEVEMKHFVFSVFCIPLNGFKPVCLLIKEQR